MILERNNIHVHNMFPNEPHQPRFFKSTTSYSRKYYEKKRLAEFGISSRNSDNLIFVKQSFPEDEKRDIVLVREKDLDKVVPRPYLEYDSFMHQPNEHQPGPPDYQQRYPSPRMPFYQSPHRPFLPPHAARGGPSWQRHYRSQVPRKRPHHLDDIFLPNFDDDEDNPLAEERFPHRSPTYRPPVRREVTRCKNVSSISKEKTTSQVETQTSKTVDNASKNKNDTKSNISSTVVSASKTNVKNKEETDIKKDSCDTKSVKKTIDQSNKKSISESEKSKKEIAISKDDKCENTNRGATSRTNEQIGAKIAKPNASSETSVKCSNTESKGKEQSAHKSKAPLKESPRQNSNTDNKILQKSKNAAKSQNTQQQSRQNLENGGQVKQETDSDTDIVKELEALINKPIVQSASVLLDKPVKQEAPDTDEKSTLEEVTRKDSTLTSKLSPEAVKKASKHPPLPKHSVQTDNHDSTVNAHQQDIKEKTDNLSRLKSDKLIEITGAPTSGHDKNIKKAKIDSDEKNVSNKIILEEAKKKTDSPPEIILVPSSPDKEDVPVQKTTEDCTKPSTPKNLQNNENQNGGDLDGHTASKPLEHNQYLGEFGMLETRKSYLGTFHQLFDDSRVVDMEISNSPNNMKETSEEQITNRVVKDMEAFWKEVSPNKCKSESSNSNLDKKDTGENLRFGEQLITGGDGSRSGETIVASVKEESNHPGTSEEKPIIPDITPKECDENKKAASDTLSVFSKDKKSNVGRARAASFTHNCNEPILGKLCRKTKSLSDFRSNNDSDKHCEADEAHGENVSQIVPIKKPSPESQCSSDNFLCSNSNSKDQPTETNQIVSKTSSTSCSQENSSEKNDSRVSTDEMKSPVGSHKIQKNESTQQKRKRETVIKSGEETSTKKKATSVASRKSEKTEPKRNNQELKKTGKTIGKRKQSSDELRVVKKPKQNVTDTPVTSDPSTSQTPAQKQSTDELKVVKKPKQNVKETAVTSDTPTPQTPARKQSSDELKVVKKPKQNVTDTPVTSDPSTSQSPAQKQSTDELKVVKKPKQNVKETAVTSDTPTPQTPARKQSSDELKVVKKPKQNVTDTPVTSDPSTSQTPAQKQSTDELKVVKKPKQNVKETAVTSDTPTLQTPARKQSSDELRMVKKPKQNSTDTPVTSDASTSQTPASQTPPKYMTKAEYIKSFARNKSPVPNIRLSIEAMPKAKSIEKRRATFTCEADNETILKKVDSGVSCRQKFLDLFGSISEDEEDLIELPSGRLDLDDKQNITSKKSHVERRASPEVLPLKKVKLDKEDKGSSKTDNMKSTQSKTVYKKNKETHSAATVDKTKNQKKNIDHDSRSKDRSSKDATSKPKNNLQSKSKEYSADVDKHLSETEELGKNTNSTKVCTPSLIVKISPLENNHSDSKNHNTHRRDSASSIESFKSNSSKLKKSDVHKNELVGKNDSVKKIKRVSDETKSKQNNDKKDDREASQNKKPKPSSNGSKVKKPNSNTGTSKTCLKETTTSDRDSNKKNATELKQKGSQKSNTDNASRDLIDTLTLDPSANTPNCNIEIYSNDKESLNSANSSTESNDICRKDSTQDNFSGSSELSLIIDEIENFPLLCRASESEIDEEKFQKCDSLKSPVLKLDKITKMSKVKDADFDTVYVNESVEIRNDTKIVQQQCKEDDVIEIRPIIPLIDLTEESAARCVESSPKDSPGELPIETKKEIMEVTETASDHATITLYRSEENVSRQEDVQAMTATIPSQLVLRSSPEAVVKKDIDSDQKYVTDKDTNVSDKPTSDYASLVQSLELNAVPEKDSMLQTQLSNTGSAVAPQKSLRLASESLENENELAISSIVNIAQPHHSDLNTTDIPNNATLKTAVSSAPLSINTSTAVVSVSPTGQNNVQTYSQASTSGSVQQKSDQSSIPEGTNISVSAAKECTDNASKNLQIEALPTQSSGQHSGLPQTLRDYRSTRRPTPVGACRPPNLVNINKNTKLAQLLANTPKSDYDINKITDQRTICSGTNQNKEPDNTQQSNSNISISSLIHQEVQEAICPDGNNAPTSIPLKTNLNPRPSTSQQNDAPNSSASILVPIHSSPRNPTSINPLTDLSNLVSSRGPVPPANETAPPNQTCINLTEDNDEVSTLDQRLVVEILTRHIYFLAHLCKAQNDYVDSLNKHTFCRTYFESEIALFERQKRARLESQSLRLATDLRQLSIDATRNLSATALLIMDQVSTNLCNRVMPQQATKSMMYLLMYQLVKPSASLFEASPFLKTLFKHCEIVVNRLYSRTGSAMTPYQRQLLTQQINEYNKIVLRQRQVNVEPSRLNNSPNLAQRQISPSVNNLNTIVNNLPTSNYQQTRYDDRSAVRSLLKRPTNNQQLMSTGQSTSSLNNSTAIPSRQLAPPPTYTPRASPPTYTPRASPPTYTPRAANVSFASPVGTANSNPINRSNFAVPGVPKPRLANPKQPRAKAAPKLSKAKTTAQNLPGGPNTVNLGSTPRYLPSYEVSTQGRVYAPSWRPIQPQPSDPVSQRPTNKNQQQNSGRLSQRLTNTNSVSPSSNYSAVVEVLDSTAPEHSGRSPVVKNLRYKVPVDLRVAPVSESSRANTVSSTPKRDGRLQTPRPNLKFHNMLPEELSPDGTANKKRNEDLLQELLSTSNSGPVFGTASSSTNDRFRIILPYTQPEAARSTVITTTANALSSIQPSASVSNTQCLSSPMDNSTASTSPTLNVLVNNQEPSTSCVVSQPKEPVVLNQGFAALSSIGPASVMLNRSSFSQTSKSKQPTEDQNTTSAKPKKQAKKASVLAAKKKVAATALSQSKVKCKTKIKQKRVTKPRKKKASIEIVNLLSSDEDEPPHDTSLPTENKPADEPPADSLTINPLQNNNSSDVEQSGLPQGSQLLTVDAEIQNPEHSVFESPSINLQVGSKETADSGTKVILNHIEGSVEEDIETIDLTWIDQVDDTELQQEIDFVVKQEAADGEGYQSEPNNVVQSPADSGISSPPVQTEDDTADYTVNVEKLCVCSATALYNCICGLAVYCGRECQLKDWDSHQKVCPAAQKGTEAEGDSGSTTEEVNPPDNT